MKTKMMAVMLLVFALLVPRVAAAADRGTASDALALVAKAGAYLKENGREKTLAEINNPQGQFIDRDLYLFVFAANNEGVTLAHGANPKLVGKAMLELRDSDGVYFVRRFLETGLNGSGKGWVDYKWVNPVSKVIEPKSTYIERFGDVLIGCGIYK